MEWIDVKDKLPEEGQLVWGANFKKGWIDLYTLEHMDNEGWFWCISNGSFYQEDGKIKGESESDDEYDITHWHANPEFKLPKD